MALEFKDEILKIFRCLFVIKNYFRINTYTSQSWKEKGQCRNQCLPASGNVILYITFIYIIYIGAYITQYAPHNTCM